MTLVMKYGVVPPTAESDDEKRARRISKLLDGVHPERVLERRVHLLESKVAILTEVVESLLKARKPRRRRSASSWSRWIARRLATGATRVAWAGCYSKCGV